MEVVIIDFGSSDNGEKSATIKPIKSLYLSYDGGRFELRINGETISNGSISNDFEVIIGEKEDG